MKLIFVVAWMALTGAVLGADDAKPSCTLATIKGTWGLTVSGTRPGSPNGPLEQFIGTAIRIYDGVGGFTQIGNAHGSISGYTPDLPGKGTYTVNADCSAVARLDVQGSPVQPEERFVIVADGNETFSATSLPATVLAVNHARRVSTVDSPSRAAQTDMLTQVLKLVTSIAFRMGLVSAN